MKDKFRRTLKVLVIGFLVIFNVIKGNFLNATVATYIFPNYGIAEGCWVLILVTATLAFVQLKFYDRLNRSFMHNEDAIEKIFEGKPQTFSQAVVWLLVNFINRWVLLIGMVTILDPFLATAFFRDLRIFKWSQVEIFLVSLVIGTMTTMLLILGFWDRAIAFIGSAQRLIFG